MSAKALELKTKGNTAFQNGDYDIAVDFFTQAIEEDPNNHVLYSNRSAAYAQLSKYTEALADADKCIELNKDFVKGYSRRGAALFSLKRFQEAKDAYNAGLALDPTNAACQEGVEAVEHELQPHDPTAQLNARFANSMEVCRNDPKLSKYLEDPEFVRKVEKLQQDPQSFVTELGDPRMQVLLARVLGIPEETFSQIGAPTQQQQQAPGTESYNMPDAPYTHTSSSTTAPSSSTTSSSSASKPSVDLSDPTVQAQQLKEQGNKLYKQKKFDEAIVYYQRAHKVNPREPTFFLNAAAVYLELANRCETSVELLQKEAAEGVPVASSKAQLVDERIAVKNALRAERIADVEARKKEKEAAKAAKKEEATQGVVRKQASADGTIAADDDSDEEEPQIEADGEEKTVDADQEEEKEKPTEEEEEKEEEIEPEVPLEDENALRQMSTEQLVEKKKKEQADLYDTAMSSCKDALALTTSSDYTIKAKIYLRMSNIETKRIHYDQALELLQKSMLEHRTDEAVRKEKELKQLIEKKKELDYLDPEKGEEARKAGNDEFTKGHFPEAIALYTDSIKRNPKDARVYSNRAACYQKLMQWSSALDDCDRAIKIDPTFIKPYVRKGNVQMYLKQYPQAMKTFEAALKIDANNQDVLQGYQELMNRIQQSQSGAADEQQIEEAMKDPEIRAIMADPVIQNVLQEMSRDPQAAQTHLQNPKIMNAISKLMAAGIIKTR